MKKSSLETNKNRFGIAWVILAISVLLPFCAWAEESNSGHVFTLGEVVVTEEGRAVNSTTTVTEISMEEILAKGAQTVAQALEFTPGVYVQNAGKGEVHVSLRGFQQNQVKVLIDGVPARESYFGTVDLSMLPASAIAKITITKGTSSVLYGSNTMGGVINIITKKGGDTPKTLATASFGDYNTAHYAADHGGRKGDINYWVAAGYQTSDGFRLSSDFNENDPVVGLGTSYNEDGGKRDLSNYLKKNLDFKVGFDPGGDSSLYLSFNYVDNERGMPTFYNRYWAFNHWSQWQVNMVGEHRFSDALNVKARLFYVDHEDGISDVSWDEAHTTGGRKWFEESYYDDSSIGGEIQTATRIGPSNTLRFGLHYLSDNHKEGDFLDGDCWDVIRGASSVGWTAEEEYAARTYTLAVEDEFSPSDRFSLVVGVSYDAFEPTRTADQPEPGKMDTINPQIGIVFTMTESTKLHASVGKKTRFPSLKELYSTYGGGNPDLDPEQAIAWEAGATHAFSDKVTLDAAFFYNDIKDLIDTTKIDGNTVYININEATIYGAEAVLRLWPSAVFSADLGYTWMITEDNANNDRELEGRPEHRFNLAMQYRFSFGLTASMQAAYACGQYWENDDGEWTELPDYFIVNAKLVQKILPAGRPDAELFFQGANLLDEDYYETSGPEPGFNFLAGITVRF